MTGKAARLADLEGSARVVWEHPDSFFERARQELPNPAVWVGELYLELHRATLTSQHKTKQGNRRTEHLLIEAELWAATAAARTGYDYPYEALDALWQQVLLQQFHDILPGTSIAWVHREAVAEYARVADRLNDIIEEALQALVGEGEVEYVVNPAPFPRPGVPALGVSPVGGFPAAAPVRVEETADSFVLTNELVRVVINRQGLIVSAVDLATGRDAIPAGAEANLLQLHQDFPNMWDAWDVDRFYRNRVDDLREVDEIVARVTEDGVAQVGIRRSFSSSTMEQTLSLAPGSRTLEIGQAVDWRETGKFLKLAFPPDVRAQHTIAETQFGANKRVTHTNTSWEAAKFETSMHRYVLVEEPGFGVALVNDSIYGFDVTRDAEDAHVTTTLRLSLLRAPRFPDPETDQGLQTHRFGLVIGTSVAGATEQGVLMNLQPRTVHGAHSFDPLVTSTGDVVISSVKLADDRSGDLVVRVYEPAGRRAAGTVRVAADVSAATETDLLEAPREGTEPVNASGEVTVVLQPFEVRTYRFQLQR